MSTRTRLGELVALANEPSSTRRRELLREITDIFIADGDHSAGEMALFDDILCKLAKDLEEEVRVELSQRLCSADARPQRLLRTLGADVIAVAEPVLRSSKALTESDLLDVARREGQLHLRAVSARENLPERVADLIVERGDDTTLGVLVRNDSAVLSRKAAETVVDRAASSPELQEAVVERQSLPVDLLNEMYFLVQGRLRARILQRNANLDPQTLQAALEAGRTRLATRDGALPPDYGAAVAHVRAMKTKGALNASALVAFLRNGERTRFLVALADSADMDFHAARRILDKRDLDALAIVCKAADFDRVLFLTFAVLVLDPAEGMAKAQQYGQLYNELPKDTALRTMRFWRVRQQRDEEAA